MTSKAFANATDANRQQGGSRNRIINGSMRIDQRNGGAAVNGSFAVDRFEFQENSGSEFTVQRSSVAPSGFSNSLLITVTTPASASASQTNRLIQRVEGNNIADLNFGSANASTVTLSFWVRSSLVGTYCAALVNNAANRAYVAEYSISEADTWEYKTITVAGDTTGTWETGTASGVQVTFDFGSGSDFNATAGSWVSANDWRTTNQVDFANTNGSTFYLTGVQLEVGDTATPFEHRSYGEELALCQRYFENNIFVYEGLENDAELSGIGYYKQVKRTTPTLTAVNQGGNTATLSGLIDRAAAQCQWWLNIGGGTAYTEKWITADAEL